MRNAYEEVEQKEVEQACEEIWRVEQTFKVEQGSYEEYSAAPQSGIFKIPSFDGKQPISDLKDLLCRLSEAKAISRVEVSFERLKNGGWVAIGVPGSIKSINWYDFPEGSPESERRYFGYYSSMKAKFSSLPSAVSAYLSQCSMGEIDVFLISEAECLEECDRHISPSILQRVELKALLKAIDFERESIKQLRDWDEWQKEKESYWQSLE